MAEIKFSNERMRDVHNRIDDIITQLKDSGNTSNESLSGISSNIQSDNIKEILSSFVNISAEKVVDTVNNLKQLDEYLVGKIGSYEAIDESGTEAMSEVQSLLDQLNI